MSAAGTNCSTRCDAAGPRCGRRAPLLPVSGERGEIVINAALGLGEAVVGGLTTPDSFTLDRTTLAVRERQTGRQEVQTVLTERGTTERPLGPERGAQSTLDDARLA